MTGTVAANPAKLETKPSIKAMPIATGKVQEEPKLSTGSKLTHQGQVEEDLRVFRNLRSKLYQWYLSNLKLNRSFTEQTAQAQVRKCINQD